MPKFIIRVESDDQSDLDFIRERCVASVEDVIAEYKDNLDEVVLVDWEWEDD